MVYHLAAGIFLLAHQSMHSPMLFQLHLMKFPDF